MKTKRLAGVVMLLAAGSMIAGAAELKSPDASTAETAAPVIGKEFQEMLAQVDAAQLELQNGKPAGFKALWSHAEDTTLSGGFGGTVEKGWEQISRRLDWVGAQFSQGSNTIERVVANESGDLRYVVQVEHIRFRVPGQTQDSNRDYRVTMIFRREANQWRIVHRQADAQMKKQAPQ
jgi:ketosteroid isomerase-like protein